MQLLCILFYVHLFCWSVLYCMVSVISVGYCQFTIAFTTSFWVDTVNAITCWSCFMNLYQNFVLIVNFVGIPVGISWRCLMMVKLEWLCYRTVKKLWRYVKPFSRFHTIPACHGRTDRIDISISRVSLLISRSGHSLTLNISKMAADTAIVTMAGEWETVPKLSNGTNFNDLEWSLT